MFAYHRRSRRRQPFDRGEDPWPPCLPGGVPAAPDLDVQMQPVLDHLRLRDLEEGQGRAHAVRISEIGAVVPLLLRNPEVPEPRLPGGETGGRRLLGIPQGDCPELRQLRGVRAVDRQTPLGGHHASSVVCANRIGWH
uniref:Uncharacterized protein n=1 Tax=Streptomyces longisporoflavus TaxID=28044 RepID=D7F1L4_9ACTN|nr:hypothetical protein [Streptomyces longisporoflavus]